MSTQFGFTTVLRIAVTVLAVMLLFPVVLFGICGIGALWIAGFGALGASLLSFGFAIGFLCIAALFGSIGELLGMAVAILELHKAQRDFAELSQGVLLDIEAELRRHHAAVESRATPRIASGSFATTPQVSGDAAHSLSLRAPSGGNNR